jgi:hypothetical protein
MQEIADWLKAARPARSRQGGGADRGGDRAGIHPCSVGCGGAQARGGTQFGVGPLRAAMSLARLWRDQGKRDEARDLLAPVYGWFSEGFDTLDLKEAKTVFDELHA